MTTFRALLARSAAAWLLGAVLVGSAYAQDAPPRNGRIVGRVFDENGNPVPGAQVGIAMNPSTATSAIDGRYTLLNVPPGPVALSVRAIGYSPKTVSGVIVPDGGVVSQDISLTSQTIEVEGISVTAEAERGSVAAALDEQRRSNNVLNAVTAEEIARTPDSDAAQAVQRVSGVTVQDGRYVFIRGLGERYTTTSLNNARLPSAEPERRVVPLDLFPSNLLDGITTTKTFSADQPGDFSGGQVNLRTREFAARRTLSFSTGAGINTAVTGRNTVRAPWIGSEWRVSAGSQRQLPAAVRDAGDFSGLTPAEVSQLIGAFRNEWSARPAGGTPSGSFSASLGGEDPVAGVPLGYLFSFGYSTGQESRLDERRAGIAGDSATQRAINAFGGTTVTSSVQLGGIANLSLRLGGAHKITFNNTMTRSGDNAATRLAGPSEEFQPTTFDITRLSYVQRSVLSNQLQGQHLLALRHQIEWSATYATMTRDEPDRSDLVYEASIDSATGAVTPVRWFGQHRAGVRTFSALDEHSVDLAANWRIELGSSRRLAVKFGAASRRVDRDADTRSYLIRNGSLSDAERAASPEQVFAQPDRLTMIPDAAAGRYTARDRVLAGYAQTELAIGRRWRAIAGLRVERWQLDLQTLSPAGQPLPDVVRRNTDLLPSLSLTWALNGSQNVRFSASQTLSRPEYREVAAIASRDIVGGYDFFGNPAVQRALIRNLDARWEWYPATGEVVSLGLFAKFFDQPIERVLQATVGLTAIRPENTKSARNVGIELEVRRSLAMLAPSLLPWSVFANVTLMHSEIQLEDSSTAAQKKVRRALTGQAPYVVNAGLGYQHPRWDLSATLLYNVVGRRITEVGTTLFPDVYEAPRHVLDLSLRFPVFRGVSGKFDARNLLDASYRHEQGSVTRLAYRAGRGFSFGLSWNP